MNCSVILIKKSDIGLKKIMFLSRKTNAEGAFDA